MLIKILDNQLNTPNMRAILFISFVKNINFETQIEQIFQSNRIKIIE